MASEDTFWKTLDHPLQIHKVAPCPQVVFGHLYGHLLNSINRCCRVDASQEVNKMNRVLYKLSSGGLESPSLAYLLEDHSIRMKHETPLQYSTVAAKAFFVDHHNDVA